VKKIDKNATQSEIEAMRGQLQSIEKKIAQHSCLIGNIRIELKEVKEQIAHINADIAGYHYDICQLENWKESLKMLKTNKGILLSMTNQEDHVKTVKDVGCKK
jgi:uncharacterized protein (UPF0128 family)